jgi:large subunit ribosomal protein L5
MDKKEKYTPRLLSEYRSDVAIKLREKFSYKNIMAVPRVEKITVNMGVNAAIEDQKALEAASADLAIITGQKPKITRSRKAISNFKLRKGLAIGCCVTLRGHRMYEFLDRMITVAFPRIRDFRGFSTHGFDGRGNYTFGLQEQTVFAEVASDRVTRTQGMNISITTSAKNDEEGRELLKLMGFPFRR